VDGTSKVPFTLEIPILKYAYLISLQTAVIFADLLTNGLFPDREMHIFTKKKKAENIRTIGENCWSSKNTNFQNRK